MRFVGINLEQNHSCSFPFGQQNDQEKKQSNNNNEISCHECDDDEGDGGGGGGNDIGGIVGGSHKIENKNFVSKWLKYTHSMRWRIENGWIEIERYHHFEIPLQIISVQIKKESMQSRNTPRIIYI